MSVTGIVIDANSRGYHFPPNARVLDVGCGPASNWVGIGPQNTLTAVDVNPAGWPRDLPYNVSCQVASGEALPYADASFDVVIARLSLPYMRPQFAIPEMVRVLAPGGRLYLSCHSGGSVLRHLLAALRDHQWKDVVYRSYALVNGVWAWAGGNPIAFPFGRRRRVEWWQTARGMRGWLARFGCVNVHSIVLMQLPRTAHYRPWILAGQKQPA